MAVQGEKLQFTIDVNGSAAKRELGELNRAQNDLKEQIKDLNKNSADYLKTKKELTRQLAENTKRQRELRQQIDINALSMRDLRQRAQDLKRSLDNMDPNTAEWKKLNADLQAVNGRMSELRGTTQQMGSKWQNLMTAMKGGIVGFVAGVGLSALSGFKDKVLETVSSFQRFEAVLTNTLGSNSEAKRTMQLIRDFAASTPFEVDQLTDAYVKLANRGFRPTLDEMTAMGDLASSLGKDMDQLVEAMLDAQTGEFERLKEFGIRATKEGDKVRMTFKGVTQEVEFNDEAIRGLILSYGEMEGVTGAMAAISQTLGGRLSNLSDSVTTMVNAIGTALLPYLNSGISLLDRWAKGLTALVDPQEKEVELLEQTRMELMRSLDVAKDRNLSDEARASLIREINAEYGNYLPHLIDEKSSIEDLTKLQSQLNEQMLQKILYMGYEEEITAILKDQVESQKGLIEAEKTRAKLRTGALGDVYKDNAAAQANIELQLKQSEAINSYIVNSTDERVNEVETRYQQLAANMGTSLAQIKASFGGVANDVELAKTKIAEAQAALQGWQDAIDADPNANTDIWRLTDEDAAKWMEARAAFAEQMRRMRMDEQAIELEDEAAHWDEMISLNEHYALGATDLEERKRAALLAINQKYDEKELQATREKEAEMVQLKRNSFQAVAQGTSQMLSFMGQYMEKGSAAAKANAIVQTTIDLATTISSAIAGATEAASAGGPSAPFLLMGYIGSMVGAVYGAFSSVSSILDSSNDPEFDTDLSVPSFGRGGILSGRRHSNGGMAVVDQYGNKQAEVEGGEAILPVDTTAANMPMIRYMLANPGKTVMPAISTSIDTAALNQSVRVPRFANGTSSMPSAAPTYAAPDMEWMKQAFAQLTSAVLTDKAKPAVVNLRSLKDRQSDLDYIKEMSDIKRA